MANVGYWALVVCFLVSLYAAIASVLGAGKKRSGRALSTSVRNGVFAAAALSTVASATLAYLLLSRDLGIRYVYEHVSRSLPTVYVLSAFWAGQEGSLLLWLWLLTWMSVIWVLGRRVWDTPAGPYVLAVMAATQAFLSLTLLLVSSPFETLGSVRLDGRGLNPLLQNIWMIAHPPVVFAGYAAYTVPFALAVGGLASGQMGHEWLRAVRRWALGAWLFLGMGILMGAYWAYLELGWGGYWGWDPVENSSLVPWLTGTALLHALAVQRQRQTFRDWTLWLIVLTFILCLFATFVTRSGVIQSVHAFGRSPIGTYFLAFIGLCLAAFVLLKRARPPEPDIRPTPDDLLSRESGFLATNLLLGGAALVVLLGTLFPALAEALRGRQVALDTSFYERTVGPLSLLLLVVLGVCPWLPWGRRLLAPAVAAAATAALLAALGMRQILPLVSLSICAFVLVSILLVFYHDLAARPRDGAPGFWRTRLRTLARNRRRYGAHVVHLGLVLMAVGVVGSSVYQQEVQIALDPGERVGVGGYTLRYDRFETLERADRQPFIATLEVSRGGRPVATLRPQKVFHWTVEQWVTEVAIHSTLAQDLYVILAGLEPDGLASFQVLINPLVAWLWIGGILMLVGGTTAWWPSTGERKAP